MDTCDSTIEIFFNRFFSSMYFAHVLLRYSFMNEHNFIYYIIHDINKHVNSQVDRRYRQYYHQMQIVVSSFDAIAGCGAAKPYTSLALQTISRHFRCLRDAITGQIQATRKSLGEQDGSGNINGVGIPRLRYVDQQLRQQRALQQLGMMQQHAWRPQRGLPESSVSILRAWLFEHFLHP